MTEQEMKVFNQLEKDILEAAEEQEAKIQAQQTQIDNLTSQILALRLIADRAAALLLAGMTPSLDKLTDEQGGILAAYSDSIQYTDMAETESAEEAFIELVVKPLNEIGKNESIQAMTLLSDALAYQTSVGLISEELKQLHEFGKLRPDLTSRCSDVFRGLMFGLKAGVMQKTDLIATYSPVVEFSGLSRSATPTVPPV